MIELLSPRKIQQSEYAKKLASSGVKGGWNYILDHSWLFEKISQYIKDYPQIYPVILDIGCGRSMLHTFLEEELNIGIIGIDRFSGQDAIDKRDRRMDLCIDFVKDDVFLKETVDIIYWCSSIEHNSIEDQKKCVCKSLEILKSNGLFLATFAYSKTTHYNEPSQQINLNAKDAVEVYGVEWKGTTDFDEMVKEYQEDIFDLDTRHFKRYGCRDYDFIVAAAEIVKE